MVNPSQWIILSLPPTIAISAGIYRADYDCVYRIIAGRSLFDPSAADPVEVFCRQLKPIRPQVAQHGPDCAQLAEQIKDTLNSMPDALIDGQANLSTRL